MLHCIDLLVISYSTRIQYGHKVLEVVGSAHICNRNFRTPQKGGSFIIVAIILAVSTVSKCFGAMRSVCM